ncbi:hypothetical protein FW778_05880 [Ginsengibacter hankyongi]|uniref:Outer membrane protein beta-barrel domain-containing protein n=1 Tax=Ginsengibacter hankyongi TaxID=2607284 RepID=A0A5J5IKK5_9BACT|nr:hypothetical protein [Ginsengibacter hankyongi]KAA9041550.1 hypothetical protein FW778_05880 [Ginsengibacter hankyongi]
MKKRLPTFRLTCFILATLSFLFSAKSYSQSLIFGNEKARVEVGINVGPLFFLGDLGGHHGKGTTFLKDLNLPLTKIMKGVFLTAYPNEWLGIRAAADIGKIDGFDNIINTKGVNELWRKQRNLDFRSNISEAYIATEIFPLMLLYSGEESYKPRLRPYGVIGVGVFHFNPQGSLTDANGNMTWYYLQPLHTEGEGFAEYPQRKNYALTQVNIPMGLGAKYYLSDRVNLSLEVLERKTFTDYIDDVSTDYIDPNLFNKYLTPQNASIARAIFDKTNSIYVAGASRFSPGSQRGNPNQTDAYFSISLKLAVRLGAIFDNIYDRNVASHMKCPKRF